MTRSPRNPDKKPTQPTWDELRQRVAEGTHQGTFLPLEHLTELAQSGRSHTWREICELFRLPLAEQQRLAHITNFKKKMIQRFGPPTREPDAFSTVWETKDFTLTLFRRSPTDFTPNLRVEPRQTAPSPPVSAQQLSLDEAWVPELPEGHTLRVLEEQAAKRKQEALKARAVQKSNAKGSTS